jgi:hypothetical protein
MLEPDIPPDERWSIAMKTAILVAFPALSPGVCVANAEPVSQPAQKDGNQYNLTAGAAGCG